MFHQREGYTKKNISQSDWYFFLYVCTTYVSRFLETYILLTQCTYRIGGGPCRSRHHRKLDFPSYDSLSLVFITRNRKGSRERERGALDAWLSSSALFFSRTTRRSASAQQKALSFPGLLETSPQSVPQRCVRKQKGSDSSSSNLSQQREPLFLRAAQHKANSDQCIAYRGPTTPKGPSSDGSGKTHSSTAETGFMVVAGRETEDRPSAPEISLLWYVQSR